MPRMNLAETQDDAPEFEDELDKDEEEGTGREDDEDDEDDEEDDDEEEGKKKPAPRRERQDLSKLERSIEELKAMAAGGTRAEQKRVSEVEKLLESMLQGGYNKDQVAALALVAQAVKADLKAEDAEGREVADRQTLDEQCFDAVDAEIDKYVKRYPAVRWAKSELRTRVGQYMARSNKFADAQARYAQKKKPAQSDFARATERIVGTFLKESGIKGSGTSDQLDIKSSRTKPSPAVSKSGEVNVDRLNDFEREIYQSTLNITKNKELALKALKRVRGQAS